MEHPLDRKWLEAQLRRVDSNQARLARALGKDRSVVNRLLNGERKLKVDDVRIIAEHLRLPVDAVLAWAGIDFGFQKGLAEMAQGEFQHTPAEQAAPSAAATKRQSKKRHPAWGALKGTTIVMPGTDLTKPTAPEWGTLDDE